MTGGTIEAGHGNHSSRGLLMAVFEEAVRAVSPSAVMPRIIPASAHGRTLVVAIGKAAAEMMRITQDAANRSIEGLVATPYSHLPKSDLDLPGVEVVEAGHPVPDEKSVQAARRALSLARELKAGDHLLALVSGGGSAVLAEPAEGVTLEDKQRLTEALLRSGASVGEINCVRKHLSAIKGGRLAVAAAPASVTTWIISDVPGDDPSLVGSGPTLADATTLADARQVIARYRLDVPAHVLRALDDPANETPVPGDPAFAAHETRIVASARTALDSAASLAAQLGLAVTSLGDRLEGEARALGADHAALARRLASRGEPRIMISGGETTVTVTHPSGRGGPNLEYLLGLAVALDGVAGISAIACDTDGIDGSTDAAGAMIFPDTLPQARRLGLDPGAHLASHRAYDFFDALGDLVITGPTLTNVNDFRAILIGGGRV